MHCSKCVSFWGTSHSRPPVDPFLTSPLLQNPGGATERIHRSQPAIAKVAITEVRYNQSLSPRRLGLALAFGLVLGLVLGYSGPWL